MINKSRWQARPVFISKVVQNSQRGALSIDADPSRYASLSAAFLVIYLMKLFGDQASQRALRATPLTGCGHF